MLNQSEIRPKWQNPVRLACANVLDEHSRPQKPERCDQNAQ